MNFDVQKENGLTLRLFNEHGKELKGNDLQDKVSWDVPEGNFWLVRFKDIKGKKFVTVTKVFSSQKGVEEIEQTVINDETENFHNQKALPLVLKGAI